MAKGVLREMHCPEDWRIRLEDLALGKQEAEPPAVFVVGAGLSRWDGKGVWGVTEIVQAIRNEHKLDLGLGDDGDAYQPTMAKLTARKPFAVDSLVRRAVLAAYNGYDRAEIEGLVGDAQERKCIKAQDSQDLWYVPPGLDALAAIIKAMDLRARSAGRPPPLVLTTNFDGLIEVALSNLHVNVTTRIVGHDAPEDGTNALAVWHLHGYWAYGATM